MKAAAWYRANGWIAAVLAGLIIALTALTGIQRGMDHQVAWGPEGEQRAMGIAISESVYGLHLGYVGLASVDKKIAEIWNPVPVETSGDIAQAKAFSSDAATINKALQAAASLGPQKIGYLTNGQLVTTYYDDMGEVDFYRLAFRLFGLQIQSYYYLYFALLAVSALVFILTYRRNPYALVTLLCTLFAFYVELQLHQFNLSAPTFPGMRHGSTLALVPMWYFVFLLGRRPSLGRAAGAVVELFILILAWRIRGSVSWIFLLLLAAALVTALIAWLQRRRGERTWWQLARATAQWPVLLLALGIAADAAYVQTELHPIYFTDDVQPYHGAWHSAYIGFEYLPEMLTSRAREAMVKYGDGDALGAWGDFDYLDRTHFVPWDGSKTIPPAVISPWTHSLKPRFHDDIMRRVFFEGVAHHPIDALILYGYLKPIAIYGVLKKVFDDAPGRGWLWAIIAGGTLGAMTLLLFTVDFEPKELGRILLLGAGTIVLANLPGEWAYPGVAARIDPLLALVTLMLFAASAGGFALIYLARTLFNLWQAPRPLLSGRLARAEAAGLLLRQEQ